MRETASIVARDVRLPLTAGTAALAAVLLVWLGISRVDLVRLQLPASPLGLAFAAIGLAAALEILLHPEVGLHVLIAVVYFNLSEVLVRRHDLPSVLDLLVIPLAGAAWIASTRRSRRAAGGGVTVLLLAYAAVLLVTTTFARDHTAADLRLIEILKATVIYVLLVLLLTSPAVIRRGIWTVVGAGALVAILGVTQTVTGRFDLEFGGIARIKLAQIYGLVFEPRIAGPLGDPNFFAQIMVMVVPLALALVWTESSRTLRSVALGCAGVLIAGIVFTYSRGGALALGVVLMLSFVGRCIDRRHVAIAAAALAVLLVLLPADFAQRLRTLAQIFPSAEATLRPDTSFEQRKLWAQTAWRIFLDHPVLGVGAGNYAAHYSEYAEAVGSVNREFERASMATYPHNLYLEIAAETGLAGAVVFGLVLVGCFVQLARARRAFLAGRDARMADLTRAVAIALTGYLLSSLFLHGDFPRYLYVLFALSAALGGAAVHPSSGAVLRNVVRSPRREPEPAALPVQPPVVVRRAIGVLLSRFPLVTETFILREVEELERQGQPVRLVPLLRERPAVMHREAEAWLSCALFTPFISPAILAANANACARQPFRYCSLLGRILASSLRSPTVLARTLALFPKCVYLAQRLHAEGIRHVHAHYATYPATAALIISSLSPITFSFTVHAHDLFVVWRRPLLRTKVRRARFIRVISSFNGCFLRALYPESAGKTRVIHVGIAAGMYESPRSPLLDGQALAQSNGVPRLLSVAALQPYKGLPVLIEACRRLKAAGFRFECDIVGEGRLRASLEDVIARAMLGDCVRLRGALRQDEVAVLLRVASIVVLPSVVAHDGQMEGIPVSLMEAMAAERPVIASAISGIPELIDHGVNGVLVEPGNANALVEAMATLLGDDARRREMGRLGREKILRAFRLDACTASLLEEVDRANPPVVEAGELARLASRAGFQGYLLGVRRTDGRSDSQVVELTAAGGQHVRDLVLKKHRSRPGESHTAIERARHERDVLARLGRCMATAGDGITLQVPRTFGMEPSDASVVMERCPGVPLDDLIRRSRSDVEIWRWLERAIGSAGVWLRHLQYVTQDLDKGLAGQAWNDLIAGAHRDLAASARQGLSRRTAASVHRYLLDMNQRLPDSVLCVGCHGDFSPGNILAAPSSLSVIDFEGFHDGLSWEDPAYFLVHLELYFAWRRRAGQFERLRATFLGHLGIPTEPVAYDLCRTVAALKALARVSTTSWRSRPQASMLDQMLARRPAC